MKKFLILFVLFLFFPFSVFAITPSQDENYRKYSYVIDKYDVKIVVNEDNTYDITEKILVYFKTDVNHGIIRDIPLQNTVERADGTKSIIRARVSNLTANEQYKKIKEKNLYSIRLGNPNRFVKGNVQYLISYKYDLENDDIKDYDELYFNIIGTNWEVPIGNVTFTIEMPKEFDASKLGFSAGRNGTSGTEKVKYTVNKNVITGSYNGVLDAFEGITVRCELEEGYFKKKISFTRIFSDIIPIFISFLEHSIFLLPILSVIISILLWLFFGKDKIVVDTVEFYPPNNHNSLEIAFLYKGHVYGKDIVSLLIYLANKGYLKIDPMYKANGTLIRNGFVVTKLKEYDGKNVNERLFFRGLQKENFLNPYSDKKTSINNPNVVTSFDLSKTFYMTAEKISNNVNSPVNENLIFAKSNNKIKNIIKFLSVLSIMPSVLLPLFNFMTGIQLIFGLIIFFAFYIPVFINLFFTKKGVTESFNLTSDVDMNSKVVQFIIILALPIFAGTYFTHLGSFILAIVCSFTMSIISNHIKKRTKYGLEMLGKIKGFKNFLETAEKEKLESLVMQNPDYFYDILPYTYVLGVSSKWIKKFSSMTLKPPTWYGTDNFNYQSFFTFVDNTMDTRENDITSRPIVRNHSSSSSVFSGSSSSGGISGGGFSGRGSGGGGGRSW